MDIFDLVLTDEEMARIAARVQNESLFFSHAIRPWSANSRPGALNDSWGSRALAG